MASKFRCRRVECGEVTEDPLAHAEAHGLPQTMTQVWESFSLVSAGSRRRDPSPDSGLDQEVLFDL